jgi:hypothetical protein
MRLEVEDGRSMLLDLAQDVVAWVAHRESRAIAN